MSSRETWAAGDFDAIASRIRVVGPRLVEHLGIGSADAVLDVACGTGNTTIPAAATGARVVGLDITPELFMQARALAAEARVEIEWVVGDAEALPYPDASFDVVMSTFGTMFAPHHERAATELARVLRPGGRLGVCSWTPEGATGELFGIVARHAPPPAGTAPPARWGVPEHVRSLFAPTGLELAFSLETVEFRFASVEDAVDVYATRFGPLVMARARTEPQGGWPALRDDLAAFFTRRNTAGDRSVAYPAEYLVALAG